MGGESILVCEREGEKQEQNNMFIYETQPGKYFNFHRKEKKR